MAVVDGGWWDGWVLRAVGDLRESLGFLGSAFGQGNYLGVWGGREDIIGFIVCWASSH